MDEFDFIEKYLAPLAGSEGLGLKDDAALFSPTDGYDLVLTQDTLVEGVHFPGGHFGADTAERLLLTNLSDLAAKGAAPFGYLLSIAWPKHLTPKQVAKWMRGFSAGLQGVQELYGFSLFGGDSVRTSGPMMVTACLIGQVPTGKMVKRSGAMPGDDIWVTGHIGEGYLGLLAVQETDTLYEHGPSDDALRQWQEAYYSPEPRLSCRDFLLEYASACADISDGLLADVKHVADASHASAILNIMDIPISKAAQKWANNNGDLMGRLELARGGDDYELVFTSSASNRAALEALPVETIQLTRIGTITEGVGLTCIGLNGEKLNVDKLGYSHL